MRTRFWQYQSATRFDQQDTSRFETWTSQQSFQRLANQALADRGIDPNLIPSLGGYRPDEPLAGTPAVPQTDAELSFSGGRPKALTEPADKAQHMLYWRAGQIYREGKDYEVAIKQARAELPSIGKFEQEGANQAFGKLLEENRKWPAGQDSRKVIETFWQDWGDVRWLGERGGIGSLLRKGISDSESHIAFVQTLSQMDPEGLSTEEKEDLVTDIWKATAQRRGKFLGVIAPIRDPTSMLMWTLLFPEFTVGMIAGEAIARPIGREIAGEKGEQYAALIGGLAGGVSLPRLSRFAAGVVGRVAAGGRAPAAAAEAGGFVPGGAKGIPEKVSPLARRQVEHVEAQSRMEQAQ
ncbi:hypothetical protein LCGC14_0872800, partial [marine sediment metagenome]